MISPKKVHWNGRVRSYFEFRPDIYSKLRQIADMEHRSMVEELSWLVLERARFLNVAGKVGKKLRKR